MLTAVQAQEVVGEFKRQLQARTSADPSIAPNIALRRGEEPVVLQKTGRCAAAEPTIAQALGLALRREQTGRTSAHDGRMTGVSRRRSRCDAPPAEPRCVDAEARRSRYVRLHRSFGQPELSADDLDRGSPPAAAEPAPAVRSARSGRHRSPRSEHAAAARKRPQPLRFFQQVGRYVEAPDITNLIAASSLSVPSIWERIRPHELQGAHYAALVLHPGQHQDLQIGTCATIASSSEVPVAPARPGRAAAGPSRGAARPASSPRRRGRSMDIDIRIDVLQQRADRVGNQRMVVDQQDFHASRIRLAGILAWIFTAACVSHAIIATVATDFDRRPGGSSDW